MINKFANRSEGFANKSQPKQQDYQVKSSNALCGKSTINKKFRRKLGIAEEILLTTSTRELVEIYWSTRKRFSGGYLGFPVEVK